MKPQVSQTSPAGYRVDGSAASVYVFRYYADEGVSIRPHGRSIWTLRIVQGALHEGRAIRDAMTPDQRGFYRECNNKREALAHAKALADGGDVTIESQTEMLVEVIAEAVVREAAAAISTDGLFGRGYEVRLAERAENVYRKSAQFRRRINAKGNSGRDHLYAFMRHWFTAYLNKEWPHLARRLPAGFSNGVFDADAVDVEQQERSSRARLAELIVKAGFEPYEPKVSSVYGFRTHLAPLVAVSRLVYHCADTDEAASVLRQARTLPNDTSTLIFWEGV